MSTPKRMCDLPHDRNQGISRAIGAIVQSFPCERRQPIGTWSAPGVPSKALFGTLAKNPPHRADITAEDEVETMISPMIERSYQLPRKRPVSGGALP
jgi:hypothetical protein